MTSPTERTLKLLRGLGYTAQVVEHWNPHAHIRQDLFGVIDVLACHQDHGILGVQATTTGNISPRAKKALASELLPVWLLAGGQFEVWGWSKKGARGKRKLWTLTRRRFRVRGGEVVVEGE